MRGHRVGQHDLTTAIRAGRRPRRSLGGKSPRSSYRQSFEALDLGQGRVYFFVRIGRSGPRGHRAVSKQECSLRSATPRGADSTWWIQNRSIILDRTGLRLPKYVPVIPPDAES